MNYKSNSKNVALLLEPIKNYGDLVGDYNRPPHARSLTGRTATNIIDFQCRWYDGKEPILVIFINGVHYMSLSKTKDESADFVEMYNRIIEKENFRMVDSSGELSLFTNLAKTIFEPEDTGLTKRAR